MKLKKLVLVTGLTLSLIIVSSLCWKNLFSNSFFYNYFWKEKSLTCIPKLSSLFSPKPQVLKRKLRSLNGIYEASPIICGSEAHYQVKNIKTGDLFVTISEYRTVNDVKSGIFSSDSHEFAAAYHYSHEGAYTWIGIWDTQTGELIRTIRKPGWIYNINIFL